MKSFLFRFTLIILCIITLNNCQSIYVTGQHVDSFAIQELKNKRLSKDEVEKLMGSPTLISEHETNQWYYIQRSLVKRAWLDPKVIEQKIIVVKFDNHDRVYEVKEFDNTYQENTKVIKDYTKTSGTELNGLQKFVKNIGRFNQKK